MDPQEYSAGVEEGIVGGEELNHPAKPNAKPPTLMEAEFALLISGQEDSLE